MELGILAKSDSFPWVLCVDKIYRTTFPSKLTMNYVVGEMTNIIHDYIDRYGNDKKIKVLIDASRLAECPESVLLTINNAIQEQSESKLAIWNRSPEFTAIESEYYTNYGHALNNLSFDSKDEAIMWLNK